MTVGSGRIMGWLQKEIGAQHRRAIGSFEGVVYGALTKELFLIEMDQVVPWKGG